MNDDAHKDDPTDDGDDRDLFDDLEDLPELDFGEEPRTPSREPEAGLSEDADSARGEAAQATPSSADEADFLEDISFDEIDVELKADAGEPQGDATQVMSAEEFQTAFEMEPQNDFETAPEFFPQSEEPTESHDEPPAEVGLDNEAIMLDEVVLAEDDEEPLALTAAETAPSGAADTPTTEKPFEFDNVSGEKMIVAPVIPKKRSVLIEVAKVVAGAVLGLVIAQVLLWWVFQLDPLGFVGKLPNALAWTVPERIRKMALASAKQRTGPPAPTIPTTEPMDSTDEEPADAGDDDVADAANAPVTPDAGIGDSTDDMRAADEPAGNRDEDLTDAANPGESVDNAVTQDRPLDSAASEPDDGSADLDGMLAENDDDDLTPPPDNPLAAAAPNKVPLAASPSESDPDAMTLPDDDVLGDLLDTESEPAGMLPPPSPEWGPVGAPTVTRKELASAIEAARAADARLDQAQLSRDATLREAAKEFYRAFADLAVKATHVDHEGADAELESSRQLVSAFEFDDKKQRLIGNAAGGWIQNDLGDGVLAGGSIENVQIVGDLPQFKLNLFGKSGRSVTVVTPMDPDHNPVSRFQNGDRVLLLGVVVRDPARNLRGYAGGEDKVVWLSDQLVRIP